MKISTLSMICLLVALLSSGVQAQESIKVKLSDSSRIVEKRVSKNKAFRIVLENFNVTYHKIFLWNAGQYDEIAYDKLKRDYILNEAFNSFRLRVTKDNEQILELVVKLKAKGGGKVYHTRFRNRIYSFRAEKKSEEKYLFRINNDTQPVDNKLFELESLDQNVFRDRYIKTIAEFYKDSDKGFYDYVFHIGKRPKNKKFRRFVKHLRREANQAILESKKFGVVFPINKMFGENKSTIIQFVGTGDIQQSVNSGQQLQANTGIGAVLKTVFTRTILIFRAIEIDASINVASTVDTLVADVDKDFNIINQGVFGNFILLPINSGQATSVHVKLFTDDGSYPSKKPGSFFRNLFTYTITGVNFSLTASKRLWRRQIDATNFRDINAAAISFRFGVFHEFIPYKQREDYSIAFGLDFSARALYGDIKNNDFADERERFIGTSKIDFYGFEPNVTLRLKNIKAQVSFPFLFAKNNEVLGLTGGQFVTAINFTGGFSLNLK